MCNTLLENKILDSMSNIKNELDCLSWRCGPDSRQEIPSTREFQRIFDDMREDMEIMISNFRYVCNGEIT